MKPVPLYWPNIVGYVRFTLLAFAFSKGQESPVDFVVAYLGALLLDGLDGYLARALNECSAFGAVLDMLCDRIATCGLLVILILKIPQWLNLGIFLIALDFSSHYVRMYASMMRGKKSHKELHGNTPLLLQLYYEKRTIMCTLYAAQEAWYLILYLSAAQRSHWMADAVISSQFAMSNLFLFFILKQWVNVLQLVNGFQVILEHKD
mmetsp:Transcript_11161/g.16866  ORF Transcript_11161/g.16866 Transcript_11161/m.16866 type:complete len:206 (+) Transcript_11161:40-657(+)